MRWLALELAQPLSALLELTYKCNWRCVFCYNPRHRDRRPLSTGEWLAVLGHLREMGTFSVALSGGEPLLHPDFFQLAGEIRNRGFMLRVLTNGTLIGEREAEQLAALKADVEVSLHGATAEVHDAATLAKGSFDALISALSHLRRAGAAVLVKILLTRLNEEQLEAMRAVAGSRGLPHKIDPTVTPRDDGDRAPLEYSASVSALERLFGDGRMEGKLGIVERKLGGYNCGLGRTTVAIDPEGNVYPCVQWRRTSLGNVRETPLAQLWRQSPERERTASVSRQANDLLVLEGGPMSSFPFCPALAYQLTDDPLSPDPASREKAAMALPPDRKEA